MICDFRWALGLQDQPFEDLTAWRMGMPGVSVRAGDSRSKLGSRVVNSPVIISWHVVRSPNQRKLCRATVRDFSWVVEGTGKAMVER